MGYCPECGTQLDGDFLYCPNCGFKLGEISHQQNESVDITQVVPQAYVSNLQKQGNSEIHFCWIIGVIYAAYSYLARDLFLQYEFEWSGLVSRVLVFLVCMLGIYIYNTLCINRNCEKSTVPLLYAAFPCFIAQTISLILTPISRMLHEDVMEGTLEAVEYSEIIQNLSAFLVVPTAIISVFIIQYLSLKNKRRIMSFVADAEQNYISTPGEVQPVESQPNTANVLPNQTITSAGTQQVNNFSNSYGYQHIQAETSGAWVTLCIISAVIAVVAFCAPIISVWDGRITLSLMDCLLEDYGDIEPGFIFLGLSTLIPAVIVFFGSLSKKGTMCAVASSIACFLVLIMFNIIGGNDATVLGEDSPLSIGFWLPWIGHGICIAVACYAQSRQNKKKS